MINKIHLLKIIFYSREIIVMKFRGELTNILFITESLLLRDISGSGHPNNSVFQGPPRQQFMVLETLDRL